MARTSLDFIGTASKLRSCGGVDGGVSGSSEDGHGNVDKIGTVAGPPIMDIIELLDAIMCELSSACHSRQ